MENKINIDGTEYEFDSLSDKAKESLLHLQNINPQLDELLLKAHQLQIAKDFFVKQLKKSLDQKE